MNESRSLGILGKIHILLWILWFINFTEIFKYVLGIWINERIAQTVFITLALVPFGYYYFMVRRARWMRKRSDVPAQKPPSDSSLTPPQAVMKILAYNRKYIIGITVGFILAVNLRSVIQGLPSDETALIIILNFLKNATGQVIATASFLHFLYPKDDEGFKHAVIISLLAPIGIVYMTITIPFTAPTREDIGTFAVVAMMGCFLFFLTAGVIFLRHNVFDW